MQIRRTVLAMAALWGLASVAGANTLRVPQDISTIQAAIDVAVDGCEIQVAPGTYFELMDLRGKRLVLTGTGGSGATVIDGSGLAWSLVTAQSGEPAGTTIRGFTFRNSSGVTFGSCFGPLSPVAGAVFVWRSALTIEDCVFEDNGPAVTAGGAILVEDGDLVVRRSRFSRNGNPDSQGNRAGYGGAIAICGTMGALTAESCTFVDNGPCGFGGGIINFFRDVVVRDCVFARNGASHGGGVASFGNTVVERSVFESNDSSFGGGLKMHINDAESGVVRDCSFFDNTASFGGGIHAYTGAGDLTGLGGTIEIVNVLATGNSASFGGGLSVSIGDEGAAAIVNATVVGNSSGIDMYGGGRGIPSLSNSIVRGNAGGQVIAGGVVRFSNVEGGFAGFGNIDADPLFANAGAGDYTLLFGSPSIDSGDDASVPVGIMTDLAGNPRFTDGDGDSTARVDMGAFEFAGGSPVDCRAGNVNAAGAGGTTDVLLVNGSAGGPARTVSLPVGGTIQVALDASPSGPSSPRYLIYAWAGAGSNPRFLSARGASLGCFVNPTPLHPGLSPQPLFCVGGQGLPAAACAGLPSKPAPAAAPWSLSRTAGSPFTLTLQGLLRDSGSSHPAGYSVMNAVTIVVGP